MKFLDEPKLVGISVGSAEFFRIQNELISERPLLKHCYEHWYNQLLQDYQTVKNPSGIALELGSGGSQLKRFIPVLTTSDIVEGFADKVIDARELPFENEAVDAFFLTHALHHIPNVRKFFEEASRCLKSNGVISMIEVANTPFAKFFFSNFHPEPFLPKLPSWDFTQSDAMLDANQALSWIVFVRDKKQFESEFPHLKIEITSYLPWLSYLVSGGVTKRNLIPKFMTKPILILEALLMPLRSIFALHWHIRIRKVDYHH
jgi:SAM-dependent methyltransferase